MLVNQMFQGGILAILDWDPTVFNDMTLPVDENDDPVVDLQDVVDHIIMKYGNAPLFCPDPAVIKYYITSWSKRRVPIWERFYKAISTEYDPLENYNRIEKFTTEFSPTTAYEQHISADNSSTYQPDRKSTSSGKDTTSVNGNVHGNIGVTTSQQMLASELDIVPRLDLIDFIADEWHEEFNLMMYN